MDWIADVVRLLVILSAFVVVSLVGYFFVRMILDRFSLEEEDKSLPGAGATIGIFERILTLALVLVGQYTAIILVLTAKSVARFETLKNREFAEYYLIGTFSSILFAMLVGTYWSWIAVDNAEGIRRPILRPFETF